jgi:creatinine amidohydrolase
MRLANISWVRAEEYFRNNDLVILAAGSVESHGRHNPLGTDTLIPDRLLDLIEAQCGGLILPTLPYGATDDLTAYPGTVSLGPDLMYALLKRIADSLAAHGARRFVVVNGHGGNTDPLDRVSLDLHRRGMWMAVFNWWQTAGVLNPRWAGGHGDFQETSGVLGVDPSLVDYDLLADEGLVNDVSEALPSQGFDYVRFRGGKVRMFRETRAYAVNGWVGEKHPRDATAETGREMLQTTADYIAAFIEELKRTPLPPARGRGI